VIEGNGMLARLGNVIYWLCTGVAAAFVVGGLSLALTSLGNVGAGIDKEKLAITAICAVLAIVFWFLGRAARSILAGR
jgi:hypothetical protein